MNGEDVEGFVGVVEGHGELEAGHVGVDGGEREPFMGGARLVVGAVSMAFEGVEKGVAAELKLIHFRVQ